MTVVFELVFNFWIKYKKHIEPNWLLSVDKNETIKINKGVIQLNS